MKEIKVKHFFGFEQLQRRNDKTAETKKLLKLVKDHKLTVTNWQMNGTFQKEFRMNIISENGIVVASGCFKKRSHAKNEQAAIISAINQIENGISKT